jgi:hypothetical protein
LASGGDQEVTLVVDVDLDNVEKAREHFPALSDRTNWLN